MPHICMPSYIHIPPVCLYTPKGVHPHMPPYSSVHLYVLGGFACWGGLSGAPFLLGHFPYTTPVWGASPSFTPPHSVVGSLCITMFWDINVMWAFSLLLKGLGVFLGVFPHQLGVRGHQHLRCPICSFWYIFCSALCPHISTTVLTTTPPVTVASSGLSSVLSVTVASFPWQGFQ